MTDDSNITRLRPRPRRVKLDGLRKPSNLPADIVSKEGFDALEALGVGLGIPHQDAMRKELREMRQRADSLAEAAASMEVAGRLIRTEAETMSRRLAQMGGEDTPNPKGAA